ncbi:hypothetical protein H4S07_003986 [Coemansia furcata]|uniref:Uncharacterized protein n=1 Tax=Coemansia furcata TaxID=417177 RepID=A0ACC1LCV4_9FUNG|nr:hypothetical protein H4S07_003986 [Coemansia furcata]
MTQVTYTFLVGFLALAHNSVAEMAEVGYAPQTMIAVQQYMVNRPDVARGNGVHGHVHGDNRAVQEHSENSEVSEDRDLRDLIDSEKSSSEVKDNSAASPRTNSLVLTAILAAGSVWAAAF